MDMSDRLDVLIPALMQVLLPALKGVLSDKISSHYSEKEWDDICMEAGKSFSLLLRDSVSVSELATAQDILDARGRLNVDGIIKALESFDTDDRNAGERAKLRHLAKYFRETCRSLNLHRR